MAIFVLNNASKLKYNRNPAKWFTVGRKIPLEKNTANSRHRIRVNIISKGSLMSGNSSVSCQNVTLQKNHMIQYHDRSDRVLNQLISFFEQAELQGWGLPSECVQRSQPLAGAEWWREDVVSNQCHRPARGAQFLNDESQKSPLFNRKHTHFCTFLVHLEIMVDTIPLRI